VVLGVWLVTSPFLHRRTLSFMAMAEVEQPLRTAPNQCRVRAWLIAAPFVPDGASGVVSPLSHSAPNPGRA
jgi:hypothetical protein